MSRRLYVLIVPLLLATSCLAQEAGKKKFNRQDHLRGAVTPEREWWDVQHYHLTLEVFPKAKSIKGSNLITFKVICLLYTSPSPRDRTRSRMPSSA